MSLYTTGVREVVDNYLIEESKKKRDYGNYWSASSAGYCMRKNMLERLKVPHVTEDPRKQRIFTSGHVFHEWVQKLTRDAGVSIAQEVELQDEDLMVRGHIDDLVLIETLQDPEKDSDNPLPHMQHIILYDYKTQNSRAFTYQQERSTSNGVQSHYHKMQLGTYMYMLRKQVLDLRAEEKKLVGGKEPSEDVGALESLGWRIGSLPSKELLTEARICKISKDDLRMREEVLNWTPALEKEVVGYWRTLNGYWKSKKFPKCTCADHEGGFMAREKFNPFYYNGEPCSLEWLKHCQKEGLVK